jgi:hypothetical protein
MSNPSFPAVSFITNFSVHAPLRELRPPCTPSTEYSEYPEWCTLSAPGTPRAPSTVLRILNYEYSVFEYSENCTPSTLSDPRTVFRKPRRVYSEHYKYCTPRTALGVHPCSAIVVTWIWGFCDFQISDSRDYCFVRNLFGTYVGEISTNK